MTSIDQYSSTCNDCAKRWTSFVGVSTNTFGMTTVEAEHWPLDTVVKANGRVKMMECLRTEAKQ